jgi:uncharacterized protein (DUF433 family)
MKLNNKLINISTKKMKAVKAMATINEQGQITLDSPLMNNKNSRVEIIILIPELAIEKTLNVCGGDACIRNTRIPVWLLVSYQQQGLSDAKILEAYPTLNAVDLANAWRYAENHPQEIAKAILENEAD